MRLDLEGDSEEEGEEEEEVLSDAQEGGATQHVGAQMARLITEF